MRIPTRAIWLGALLCLTACGGIAPPPDQFEVPAPRELDDVDRRRVLELELKARSALGAGAYDTATEAARDGLAIDPRHGILRALLGRALMGRAQRERPPRLDLWHDAERELRLASTLAPTDPEVAIAHLQMLEADGHLTAAVELLDPVLAANPRDPRLLREASRLRYELGEERAALPHLVLLLVLEPEDAETRWRLAQCQLAMAAAAPPAEAPKLYREAASSFAQYRVLRPDDAGGALGEGYALLTLADLDEPATPQELAAVLPHFVAAARLAPREPDPLYAQALLHERLGTPDVAIALYREAIVRDPSHVPAHLNLVAALAANDDPGQARAAAMRALALPLPANERDRLREFLKRP